MPQLTAYRKESAVSLAIENLCNAQHCMKLRLSLTTRQTLPHFRQFTASKQMQKYANYHQFCVS